MNSISILRANINAFHVFQKNERRKKEFWIAIFGDVHVPRTSERARAPGDPEHEMLTIVNIYMAFDGRQLMQRAHQGQKYTLNIAQLDLKSHYLLFIMNVKRERKSKEKKRKYKNTEWKKNNRRSESSTCALSRQNRQKMPGERNNNTNNNKYFIK